MLYWYFNFLAIYILIAGLLGAWKWNTLEKSHWKHFSIYLIIIGLVQTLGIFLIKYDLNNVNNLIVDYGVIPFEFLFIYYLYYKEAETTFAKNLSIISAIGYVLSFAIQLLLLRSKSAYAFFSFSYLMGNIFLASIILTYFWNLILSNKILDFKKERMFWVSFGMLIFWLGTLPFFGLYNYLFSNFRPIFSFYYKIMFILNYVMYSFFIYSFIWIKKKNS
ncbi:MAG: hypothetical protein IPN72_17960 [Saprospiraceae bacterium]|nr:hypothetical protein [Saprospiraceae bacterium]